MIDKYVNVKEIAEWLGVAEVTLWRWIADGKFPKPVKLGRSSRWRTSTVEAHLADMHALVDADAAHSAAEQGQAA
jgi:prophage regulatory protein